jgi:hypothetical protein
MARFLRSVFGVFFGVLLCLSSAFAAIPQTVVGYGVTSISGSYPDLNSACSAYNSFISSNFWPTAVQTCSAPPVGSLYGVVVVAAISDGRTSSSQIYAVMGCSSNATAAGSSCVCNSGFTESNGQCVSSAPVSSCKSGNIDSVGYFDGGTSYVPGGEDVSGGPPSTACNNGCLVAFSGVFPSGSAVVDGVKHWYAAGAYTETGSSCSGSSNMPAGSVSDPSGSVSCSNGQVTGTVNGTTVCVDPGSTSPSDSASSPSGAASSPSGAASSPSDTASAPSSTASDSGGSTSGGGSSNSGSTSSSSNPSDAASQPSSAASGAGSSSSGGSTSGGGTSGGSGGSGGSGTGTGTGSNGGSSGSGSSSSGASGSSSTSSSDNPCTANPMASGCGGDPASVDPSSIYSSKGRTFAQVLSDAQGRLMGSGIGAAVTGFFSVSDGGSCPSYKGSIPFLNAEVDFSFFCSDFVINALGILKTVLLVCAGFFAFRIAIE